MDSCCPDRDKCYELELIALKNFNLDGNYETTGVDTIAANDYAIEIESKAIEKTCSVDFSSGGSLYAFECDPPTYTLIDKVTNISIKSNADLSLNFPAGSELKGLFFPAGLLVSCIGESGDNADCLDDLSKFRGVNSMEDAFNNIMSENIFLLEVQGEGVPSLNLFVMRTDETIIEHNHQFTITFNFESGKTVELKTDEVRIN